MSRLGCCVLHEEQDIRRWYAKSWERDRVEMFGVRRAVRENM